MKFFLSFAAVVAVAVAGPTKGLVSPGVAGPAPIIDDFVPIAVGPAIIDEFEPISVGPAIVNEFEPISVGPAIVDEFVPISVGPAIVDSPPLAPVADSTPLVQIILNINQASSAPIVPGPGVDAIIPEPVIVVDEAEIVAEPVIVVDGPVPKPVQVADITPVAPKPVIVATPIIPAPAVTLPETLN
ncbi:hypothetical protein F0L74_32790 [Chitinophaga agrisoli]|uniref:Uncharacterized protein n=1 Tax=Chitinophaga agrisoli TaxID=2607653 RepID=A0A5B2VCE4_9BACT|nr:hypothetical protein F0L74_32790 [Chitinophaga agrisoli]